MLSFKLPVSVGHVMRVGCKIHTQGPSRLDIREAARTAEAAGADSLWIEDHIVVVDEAGAPHPRPRDDPRDASLRQDRLDALVCCSWLAAATSRVQVSTGVLVAPQRNPVELAKACASIDHLSGGRLRIGAGVGWSRAEMEALGYEFASRGARMDEQVTVMRGCWQGGVPPFEGTHVRVPAGVRCYPVPRAGSIPILIGGESDAALRRAARLGDGWVAITSAGDPGADGLAGRIRRLNSLRASANAPRDPFQLAVLLYDRDPAAFGLTTGQYARRLSDQAARLGELGFTEVGIDPLWRTLDDAAEIIAAVRDSLN